MEAESGNERIILTGFGKFQGVAENPTEILVQRLKNEVRMSLATLHQRTAGI
jgi:hypothetical protein